MFDLSSVLLLAGISVVVALFWQFRRLGERAQSYAQHYCKQHQLQYLDIARHSGNFILHRRGPVWKTTFSFGFSSDKEHRYEGQLIFANTRLVEVKMPVYRVPEDPQDPVRPPPRRETQHDYRPSDWYQGK